MSRLNGPRAVHLEHQVPDAIFVHDDGTRVVLIELARTDDLVEGYWRDQSAAKDEKYRPLREAMRQPPELLLFRPLSLLDSGVECVSQSGGSSWHH